jgi:hypothetical protein
MRDDGPRRRVGTVRSTYSFRPSPEPHPRRHTAHVDALIPYESACCLPACRYGACPLFPIRFPYPQLGPALQNICLLACLVACFASLTPPPPPPPLDPSLQGKERKLFSMISRLVISNFSSLHHQPICRRVNRDSESNSSSSSFNLSLEGNFLP